MASEPKMTDDDKRDLCEAVWWKLSNHGTAAYSGPGNRRLPWSNDDDALAAL
jgi:hypothetical protein